MAKKVISFSEIFKRQSCLSSSSESVDSRSRFNNLNSKLENWDGKDITPSISSSMNSYLDSLCTIDNASQNYDSVIGLIDRFENVNEKFTGIVHKHFVNQILPYMSNPEYAIEAVGRYENISDEHRTAIVEKANAMIVADRVLGNYKALNKRFKINEMKITDPNRFAESICEKVDTYDVPSYQKMNICIEESCYILEKNNVKYNKNTVVDTIGRYFMMIESVVTDQDITGYKKVLEENAFLEDGEYCTYIGREDVADEPHSIAQTIELILNLPEKTYDNVAKLLVGACSCSTVEDLCHNMEDLIKIFWDLYKFDTIEIADQQITHIFSNMADILSERDLEPGDYNAIIGSAERAKESIVVAYNARLDYREKVFYFKDKITQFQQHLDSIKNSAYNMENVQNIGEIRSILDTEKMMTLQEFKIFKFHNLLTATWNFSKWLKNKNKKMNDKLKSGGKNIFKKVKDILFPESTDVYATINEFDRFDVCVAQYEYISEEDLGIINSYFEDICHEYNQMLETNQKYNVKAFYIINPGIVEVHLGCKDRIAVTEEEHNQIINTLSEADETYIEMFYEYAMSFEALADLTMDHIFNLVENHRFTKEEFEVVQEALSIIGIERKTMYTLAESVDMEVSESWAPVEDVEFTVTDIAEAYQILQVVSEKAPAINADQIHDPDFDGTVVKDGKKVNPFKGLNLNSLKLYLFGLKKKASKASQKEREISRNMDNSFRRLVKNMKNALISDRREAIIKGSVIPSFSRCIKIAIALAGLGLIFQNPAVPIIAAIGGFAMSKNLTKKERILMLDEIETELEVLDKEIANAESANKMKRLRALLKYKKDLQRQYQRIRYNVRVGKDILPNSASGVRTNED